MTSNAKAQRFSPLLLDADELCLSDFGCAHVRIATRQPLSGVSGLSGPMTNDSLNRLVFGRPASSTPVAAPIVTRGRLKLCTRRCGGGGGSGRQRPAAASAAATRQCDVAGASFAH